MELELRFTPTSFDTSGETLKVEGLVNQTESWSHILGVRKKFREKISRGAFSKALQEQDRIDFLAEHDNTRILSTTENGSLELWEDEEGLKMRAEICPTTYGKDMYELMRSKIVNHMSFGFKVVSDKWKKLSNGIYERVIEELQLLEVSAVRNPAYPQSAIVARGIDVIDDVEVPSYADEIIEEGDRDMSKEQRAYASYLYSKTDVVNSAMNIIAECSSLSGYLMKYVGEDKDTAAVLVSLQHTITMANKIINDEIQVLVDDFNAIDSQIKGSSDEEDTRSENVEEVVETAEENKEAENIEENVEEKENVEENIEENVDNNVEENDEKLDEKVDENVEETVEEKVNEDENRSFDLSYYKQRLKNKL